MEATKTQKPRRWKSFLLTIFGLVIVLLVCLGGLIFAWGGGYAKSLVCNSVISGSYIHSRLDCNASENITNTASRFPLVTPDLDNNSAQSAEDGQLQAQNVIENAGGGVVGIGVFADNGQEQIIGTGFLVSQGGLLVTNRHVVENEQQSYYIVFRDSKSPIQVVNTNIFRDPVNDIALIKIEKELIPSGAKPITVGDSDNLKLGQTVIAIGNPLGTFTGTATKGIISGLHREVSVGQGLFGGQGSTFQDVIQTDAAINPGNSGGPLLSIRGEAIGVNFATIEGASNLSFALPINRIKQRIAELEQYNKFRIPYLGVQYQTKVVFLNNVSMVGAQIVSVLAQSPAEAAGIKVGDIIVEFNGTSLDDSALTGLIQATRIGDNVEIVLIRNRKEQTVTAVIQER